MSFLLTFNIGKNFNNKGRQFVASAKAHDMMGHLISCMPFSGRSWSTHICVIHKIDHDKACIYPQIPKPMKVGKAIGDLIDVFMPSYSSLLGVKCLGSGIQPGLNKFKRIDRCGGSRRTHLPHMCLGLNKQARTRMSFSVRMVLLVIAFISWSESALAHEVRPSLMQIEEIGEGDYDVTWKRPIVGDLALRLIPRLSSGALDQPPATQSGLGFVIYNWKVRGGAPLSGQLLEIDGLSQSVTETLVRVKTRDGKTTNWIMRPASPQLKLDFSSSSGIALSGYLGLGIEHILTGFDHLLFLLALVLLVGRKWMIIKVVTAFTVAHSITLGLATLGLIRVSTTAVEVLIALSILCVAAELASSKSAKTSLTHQYPWLVAFLFGLLHGLGFAGALAAVGLPPDATIESLLLFNIGVETGQLAFILSVMAIWRAAEIYLIRWHQGKDFAYRGLAVTTYGIGGMSAYWFIDRTVAALAF